MSVDPPQYVEEVLQLIREHALNWPRLEATDFLARYRVAALLLASNDRESLHALVRRALAELGDRHSHLKPAVIAGGGPRANRDPAGRMIGRVALVEVPGFSGDAAAANVFAGMLRERIAELEALSPRGWIVDLRANGGGNMWPMLRGLLPLLGDGDLGAFVAPGKPTIAWAVREGRLLYDGKPASPDACEPLAVRPVPIAVLTSRRTVSSGEAVAVAFRGWDRARSFGQPTFGLSTANEGFPLSDGALLNLTVSVFADRTGRVYGGSLDPDELVDVGDDDEDRAVGAALRWIGSRTAGPTP